ncbi:IS110 family transposase (plasmid) [Peteryoungia desertarenae]|uniref:IS110 family transposase n=1 Tax=Peteryoungia desertarenae TaxID=1813451 RepID=A0ABX6QSZ9_9HYPH|nr:IS110 family transposase [Peteryoungia desertarenae]QLF71634.1 IS110 family transposase [Peteryoungia desertarenae]
MTQVHILAIDLAKRSFQVCGTDRGGAVLFNRVLSRARLQQFLSEQSPCIVAMEACATSHFWGRFARSHGHDVRLIPPIYVKPFVKRQKNDAADAAAIAEAALRPNMHYVAVKSAEHQARAVAFRTHQCFVRQRTQLINALRGHLAEFGIVVAQGPANLSAVAGILAEEAVDLPDGVRVIGQLYLDQIGMLSEKIDELSLKLREATKSNEDMRRLCTVPGVGPVTAGAILAFAPDLRAFKSGRNFAAWLGLVPRQHSTGGKTRLGGVSKMGQTDIRRLLIVGAMSLIRWIVRKGVLPDNWLGHILDRKPRMVAAVALANKMARIIWAMMTREQNYRMA